MNRVQCLFESPALSILRFDHWPETEHCDDGEEVCPATAINFVESGSFELGIEKLSWVLAEGAQFISRPGIVHRYRHFHGTPSDVCISARYSHPFTEEEGSLPDCNGSFRTTNRLAFLKLCLPGLVQNRDRLALESWGCDLLQAVQSPRDVAARLYRPQQLRWYAERVGAARNLLEREFAQPHSLHDMARKVGMSTFQFARVFHELVGSPPHHYLLQFRLDHARQLLWDGISVTDTCYESGFLNLSHFIRSFRRRFGCSPSKIVARKKQLK
jgi:AraC-like DNA-binding protein